jgi:hypothetical protein
MTAIDFSTYVASGATVIAAIYAALSYHRPTAGISGVDKTTTSASRLFVRWAPPLIALLAVGFGYYDRHYSDQSHKFGEEEPLPDNVSRLVITRWVPHFDKDHLFINGYLANKGISAITGMQHAGILPMTPGLLTEADIAPMFVWLRAQLSFSPVVPNQQIQPGDDQQ